MGSAAASRGTTRRVTTAVVRKTRQREKDVEGSMQALAVSWCCVSLGA